MKKYILAAAVTLTAAFAGCKTDGYRPDVWVEISTAAQLDAVRNNMAGNYILMNDISLADYANWAPIGMGTNWAFSGKFNGNGHKITNLTINRPEEDFVGLFRYIGGSSSSNIRDLGVEIGAGGINGGDSAGGIAGGGHAVTIINCYTTGDVTSTNCSGGIVGWLGGDSNTITGCHSTGNISAIIPASSDNDMDDAGGIAGVMWNCTTTSCYSMGNIYASELGYSGGIAGEGGNVSGGAITGCHSTGNISSDYGYAGGIVGWTYYTITNSYSAGNIYCSYYVGGIAGAMDGGTIANCYSTGDVADWLSGGIVGDVSNSTITNCYSAGNITGSAAGGIAGVEWGNNTITSCAAINPTINTTGSYGVGRIVGQIDSTLGASTITNNFALDAMTATGTAQFDASDPMSYGVSRSIEQLQMQETYSGTPVGDGLGGLGWKFGTSDAAPWKMPAGGGYPVFYWQ